MFTLSSIICTTLTLSLSLSQFLTHSYSLSFSPTVLCLLTCLLPYSLILSFILSNCSLSLNLSSSPHTSPLSSSGYAAVHIAAQNGDFRTLECLISAKADVDCLDTMAQWTPLLFASQNGHMLTVRFAIYQRR